ncbi:fibronectin type III domain-containing protein, partial [Microbacterium sp. CIAB417]|uniref:fibronectin type III domain-containing protein n=1 Tax=Microbacterium sp. CIAB417 TaxID=2860287 RepID=UPI001FAC461A
PPLQPAAPTTAEMAPVGDRAQMNVSWVAPDNNGDAISGYQLQVLQGSSVVQTISVAAGKTSQAVVVDTSTTSYTYQVRAQNKADWGPWSDASAPRRGVIKPDTPPRPSAAAGDGRLTLSGYQLSESQLNGASTGETSYQFNLNKGGGWQSNWDGKTITGLNNGTSYSVSVRAVANVDGKNYISDPSAASAAQTPYGVPPAPSVTAKNNGQSITFSWNPSGNNGSAIDAARISINGGGWQSVSANSSTTVGNGYQQSYSIRVQVHNKAGWSGDGTASARTSDPPAPRVWVTQGSRDPQGCVNGCMNFYVNWQNLNIGTYNVKCYSSAYPGGVSNYTYSINFDGNGGKEIACHQGRDGVDVWVDIIGWGGGVDTEKNYWPRP